MSSITGQQVSEIFKILVSYNRAVSVGIWYHSRALWHRRDILIAIAFDRAEVIARSVCMVRGWRGGASSQARVQGGR